MRILQVTSLFSPDRVGGAEIFVEDLARGLAEKGHAVAVAAISRKQEAVELRDGFAIHRLGHTTPFFIGEWEQQPGWKRKYYKIAVQLDRASCAGLRLSLMISVRTSSTPIHYRN